jgi:predicted ATPase/class 3 adenylate cyclase
LGESVSQLPAGVVTFLFTDIEGSTRLLQHVGEANYARLQETQRSLLRSAFAAHRGVELRTVGDGCFAAFPSAGDALAAALEAQLALAAYPWRDGAVKVRMGLDTGEATPIEGEYTALVVNRAARITSAAHGGQILVSAATSAAAGDPPGASRLESLGRHRLKDLTAPVELFQLRHADLAGDFPAPRSLEVVAHNLPIQISSFVGRHIERAEVAKALASGRLVTLVGAGGAGKTRLAYQVAADTLEIYTGGIWVAELAATSEPDDVADMLMTALGLRQPAGRTATETIVDDLRARTALVVLDNCEHVIASATGLARAILESCPDVRVLATSREALRLQGELVYHVPGLTLPSSQLPSDVTDVAAADAVQLFVSRATDVRPDFALTPDGLDAVTAICLRLDGLPLAIELAASRVRTLSLTQLHERLADALDLLTKGSREADARQATLRGAITWSHDLLSETERAVFRRLAVFTGGWRLDAAEAVCGGDDGVERARVLDVLDALVDKSLVALRDDSDGEVRYRFLETIRDYAAEQLERSGDAAAVCDRFAAWCLALAAPPSGDKEARGEASWYDRLEADHPNLVAGLAVLHARGDPDELELCDRLAQFWVTRGHWHLAREEFRRALAAHPAPTANRSAVLANLASVASDLGDYTEAKALYEDAITISRAIGDRRGECARLGGLGTVAYYMGEYAEAGARFRDAVAITQETGDREKEGHWTAHVGVVAYAQSDYPAARRHLEVALTIAQEFGDRETEGHWLGNLGGIAAILGDYADAERRYEQALAIARQVGDRRGEVNWLGCLGRTANARGAYAEAAPRFTAALTIAREIGDRQAEGHWLGGLGAVAIRLGDFDGAVTALTDALEIARDIGDRSDQCTLLIRLGDVACRRHDIGTARQHAREALALAAELGTTAPAVSAVELVATILSALGRHRDALELVVWAGETRQQTGFARDQYVREQAERVVDDAHTALPPSSVATATAAAAALSVGDALVRAADLVRDVTDPPAA